MPGTPSVSVIIAAYNAAGFIAAAIASALQQTLQPLEILVIDDVSRDDTARVVEQLALATPSLRLMRMQTNGGPSATRNAGIEAARGDWIAVLDADDLFEPTRLEILMAHADEADILVDDLAYFDHAAQQVCGPSLLDRANPAAFVITPGDFVRNNQGGSRDWGLLKPVFCREYMAGRGLRYPPGRRHGEDFDLMLDCLLTGARLICVPEPLYRYTMRHGAISKKESGLSRTRTDYAGMAAMARQWATDQRLADAPETVRLLHARAHSLDRRAEFEAMLAALATRRIGQLARMILIRPAFVIVLARHVFRYVRSRLAWHSPT